MSLKLAARLVTVDPYKIADLKENDTIAHTLDLSSILPLETKALILHADLIAGAGNFLVFPLSHATYTVNLGGTQDFPFILPIKNQELKWKNSVADDEWDIYLLGYFVQRRTR